MGSNYKLFDILNSMRPDTDIENFSSTSTYISNSSIQSNGFDATKSPKLVSYVSLEDGTHAFEETLAAYCKFKFKNELLTINY